MSRSRYYPGPRHDRSWIDHRAEALVYGLFCEVANDGEAEYRDVVEMPFGDRLDYVASAIRHVIDARTRHHYSSRAAPHKLHDKQARVAEFVRKMMGEAAEPSLGSWLIECPACGYCYLPDSSPHVCNGRD